MINLKDPDGERDEWILVTERLPLFDGKYLITYRRNPMKENLVALSRFKNGSFDMKDAIILAWRHIPYPYIE